MSERSTLREMIASQPAAVAGVLLAASDACMQAGRACAAAQRVFVCGTGTSSHAAVVGEHLLRSAGIEAYATTSSDLSLYPRPLRPTDAVIVISHTGGTQFGAKVIELARAAGATAIGITRDDSRMRHDDIRISTGASERSDTYTVSYVTSLAVLAAVAVAAGRLRDADTLALSTALGRLPEALGQVVALSADVEAVAQAAAARGRILLIGAGPNTVTAREGALKIKESSYLTAEGFEVETAIHGALQAIEPEDIAVLICCAGPARERVLDASRILHGIGARNWIVCDRAASGGIAALEGGGDATWVTTVPDAPEPLSPALTVVPLQLFAARLAELRGTNPDNFRFDVPAFKQAYGAVIL